MNNDTIMLLKECELSNNIENYYDFFVSNKAKILSIICLKGYYNLLLKLYDIDKKFIIDKSEYGFYLASLNNHIKLVEFFSEISNIYSVIDEFLVTMICKIGHLRILQKFYEIKPNIINFIEDGFIEACYHNKINIIDQIVIWIPDIDFDNIQYKFIESNEIKNKLYELLQNKRKKWMNKTYDMDIDCLICYNNTKNCITPCKHIFCSECINKWLLNSNICPYCKKII